MKIVKKKVFLIRILAIIAVAAIAYFGLRLLIAPKPNPKILLIHSNGFGEQETVARLLVAVQRLNIDLHVINSMDDHQVVDKKVHDELHNFKPDFILAIEDSVNYYPGVPNYLTLTRGGYNRYLITAPNGILNLACSRFAKFDALLPSLSDFKLIKDAFEINGKKFLGFSWYPTVYSTDYPPAVPQKLFYTGGVRWDSTRSSEKYTEVFKKLDQTGYLRVCGIDDFWRHTPNSIIGFLPFDGKSVIAKLHQYGVSLILHYRDHMDGGAPTARIFEAAAANAVIISDRHPFLVENFGDNILYIDIDQDADTLFKQIDQHMQWILSHPTEAQRMAAKCHAIVEERFTLEQQLQALLKMHKKIVKLKP